ncbi:Flp pilus assembly complex ATPase component TadA [bacterium]|nr:Flp pilus assembly complex ATPase component TadA [bacterium]
MPTTPKPEQARPAEVKGGNGRGRKGGFDPSKFSVASVAGGENRYLDPTSAAAKPRTPVALSAVLEEAGLVNKEMINELLSGGNESAQSLKRSLIQQGLVNEEDILAAVAEQAGMEKISLRDVTVTKDLLDVIPPAIAKKYHIFPVSVSDDEVVIALSDPTNIDAADDLRLFLNKHITCVVASENEVERYIVKYYEGDQIGQIYKEFTADSSDPFSRSLEEYETIALEDEDRSQHPAVRFVDLVFKQAVHEGASDIHVEPTRTGLRIRFRVDGVLQDLPSPPAVWKNMIISRLKVMSSMDLAEKRVPQDGRIKLTLPEKSLDLRVSSLPSIFGETIVMRILDQADVLMGLEDVGFLPDSIQLFEKLIRTPNGIILMTGPTGSGKTTTLNSALSTLNKPETKIITVEDPVEYQIQGINQIQVNTEAELTFGIALRSMLRMSPDVIMVGEIRDVETAEIAIRAALTGHLVFSTLHTNDAPSSTIRLIDMGVKPFLVASSIQAVIAQRLIRRICGNCKHEITPKPEALREMGVDPEIYAGRQFFQGVGCDRCNNTGYRGRTAIHEIFVMTPELRKMVIRAESNLKIKRAAIQSGMRTLRQDGLEKCALGQTTLEEVMRITQMD